jgi:hypothetical protein
LYQGKTQFDAVREMNFEPKFYKFALGMNNITSPETLRQRMDQVNGLEVAANTNYLVNTDFALINRANKVY